MKAACDRAILTRGVQVSAGVVAQRSPKPALGCIKMEAQPEEVMLLATDLEVGIRVRLDKMEVTEPGAALVPADRFHAILRELEEDTVSISCAEQETTIEAPNAHFTVLGDDPADFPQVPEFPEEALSKWPPTTCSLWQNVPC